ncbi:hypothetical protein BDB01DRAFT_789524 [Pilobolus umbonatus]|nr:hypothetical protein BDB01DRAFT_789524 [Pilobolus umbonatus]
MGDDYDFEDPFIDDSDMLMNEPGSPVESTINGFFVYTGPLDGNSIIEKKPKKTTKGKEKSVTVQKKEKPRPKKEEEGKKSIQSTVAAMAAALAAVTLPSTVKSKKPIVSPLLKAESKVSIKKPISANPIKKKKKADKEDSKVIKGDSEKKKKNEIVELQPLDPEVLALVEKIRKDATLENFENKAKFPPNLKPTVLEAGLVTLRKFKTIDDNLVFHLMTILPYNRFTLKKFLTTKAGQLRVDELQQEIDELAILLKQTIDRMMPEQQRQFNEKIASTPTNVEIVKLDEDERPTPKFRCNDEVRKILYDIIQTEEQSIYVSNQIAILRDYPERPEVVLNESKARKSMYQRLLSCWPEGWMNTYEMSRQYSQYKAKVVSQTSDKVNTAGVNKRPYSSPVSTGDVKKRKKTMEEKKKSSDSEEPPKPWQPSSSMKIESLISGKYNSQ